MHESIVLLLAASGKNGWAGIHGHKLILAMKQCIPLRDSLCYGIAYKKERHFMAYDTDNIFAKILRGEAPAFKVYEDDYALAFMDVMPQVEGHTLVIPKDPAENLLDADPVILGATIQVVQTVAEAVKQAFSAPGIMIAQLNGVAAGQSVFHLHFHIMPRFEGLEFKIHAQNMEYPAKLEQHAERIRNLLS